MYSLNDNGLFPHFNPYAFYFSSITTLSSTIFNRKGDSEQLISSQIRGVKPTVAKCILLTSRKGFFIRESSQQPLKWRMGKETSGKHVSRDEGLSHGFKTDLDVAANV